MPAGALEEMMRFLSVSNASTSGIVGLLTAGNARTALQALQTHVGVEVLGEPGMTLSSGGQGQMRATEKKWFGTNIMVSEPWNNQAAATSGSNFTPGVIPIETGPSLDVVSHLLDDGCTIDMTTSASLTEFLGFAQFPPPLASHAAMRSVTNAARLELSGSQVWPVVWERMASTHVDLYDGQTLLLVLDPARAKQVNLSGPDDWRDANVEEIISQAKKRRLQVLVFVTATLVDTANQPVHSAEELPFAQQGFPPQPKGE